jgi:glycosyltransferase involved in cell wall biosynthesis
MVTGSYPPQPCGVGDYTYRLVAELRRAGVAVSVVTTADPKRTENEGLVAELTDWSARSWRRALRGVPAGSFDLMHVQYPGRFYGFTPAQSLMTFIARSAAPELPRLLTVHEFSVANPLRRLTVAALAAGADAVTVTDGAEEAAFRRAMPWLSPKLHRIPMASTVPVLAVTPDERRTIRAMTGFGEGDFLVSYFGFLHPNKGIEFLLETFARLLRAFPSARLQMLSRFEPEGNPYHASLCRKTTALGLEGAVRWAGYRPLEEISRRLGASDAAFLPYAEGVSMRRLSFLTAMSHGLPVVTTRSAAGASMPGLQDGVNVLLAGRGADPGTAAALLLRLVENPELRASLGAAAREWSAPFRWPAVADRTMQLYQDLVRAKGRTR